MSLTNSLNNVGTRAMNHFAFGVTKICSIVVSFGCSFALLLWRLAFTSLFTKSKTLCSRTNIANATAPMTANTPYS